MCDYLTICESAARAGGAVLLEKLGRVQFREKAPADLVTDADISSQNAVSDLILGAFPQHCILGEEDVPEKVRENSSVFRWLIDPLDGTTNFVHQVPHFCVSIALQRGYELLAAAVYNPIADECFTAAPGSGALLNGRPIHASSIRNIRESLCGVGFPPGTEGDSPDLRAFLHTLPKCQALRRTGSAALNLCYVAAGRFDAAWSFSTKIWDMAAGTLIVREAGGMVTEPEGRGNCLDTGHYLAAATPELHDQLLALFHSNHGQIPPLAARPIL